MRSRNVCCALFLLFFDVSFGARAAGLSGQPRPTPEMTARIDAAVQQLMKGDVGTARPDLLLAIEANPAADMTDSLSRIVGDDTTYTGIAATIDEAVAKSAPGDPNRPFLYYNLAHVHLLRARLLASSLGGWRMPLDAAARAAAHFDETLRDAAAWELKGDIESERGNLDGALTAYKKIATMGGNNAMTLYKSAGAYQRANRLPAAEGEYQAALRAQTASGAGGPLLKHLIYQGLASAELQQGNDPAALEALALSARVGQDEGNPFTYRTDVARRFLQRGHAREVLSYAQAALKAAPDDVEARRLRDEAAARLPPRRAGR